MTAPPKMEFTKMKTSRKHLLAAAVSLPLALTLLSACGGTEGTITMGGSAGPAAGSTATTTTTPATSPATSSPTTTATKSTTTKATATKTVANKSTTNGTKKTTKPPTGPAVLSGTRAVVIVPVPSFESVLAIDTDGRLGLTDAEADFFVFSPVGGRFQIKTDGIAANTGEPACLKVKSNGGQPLTVVGAVCKASDERQLFDVEADGKNYVISNASAFLQVDGDGLLIAQELGDAPLETSFKLVDNGRANTASD